MRLYRSGQLIRPDLKAHINSRALLDNVAALKSRCAPNTKYCAVVKANAYGHGMVEIVNLLKYDADYFAVASLYEALYIAYLINDSPILILEPLNTNQPAEQLISCAENDFHCVISSLDAIGHAERILSGTRHELRLHVNVETGMNRGGLDTDSAVEAINRIRSSEVLELAGVFTHFATADETDLSYVSFQHERFEKFLKMTDVRDDDGVLVHAANSAAAIKMPETHYDMVRCGIAMYGYYSRPMENPPVSLRPVMKLQAPIVNIKQIPAGSFVSYGCSYKTQRDTLAAMIPLGYADGYFRCFSNTSVMRIDEHYVPVLGRVCMDQILIDVTDVPGVKTGRMVTIIDDKHNSKCGVYALCALADTICYEILTCVHSHVSRIVD